MSFPALISNSKKEQKGIQISTYAVPYENFDTLNSTADHPPLISDSFIPYLNIRCILRKKTHILFPLIEWSFDIRPK
jgi:hypothetical protein